MATTSNIAINSVSAIADIGINSVNMIEAYHWNGTNLNLVWQKGGAAPTWIANISGNAYLYEYTPSSNMSVANFSVRMADINMGYASNWACGIYTKTGSGYPYTATPVTNACSFSDWTNVAFVFEQVYLTYNQYKITKTYLSGSQPSLTAGTTYYFLLAERYPSPSTYQVLSGNASGAYTDDWRLSAASSFQVNTASANTFYLEVIPA